MSFTIAVYHHILPNVFWRATNDADNPVGAIAPAPWSKEPTLTMLDAESLLLQARQQDAALASVAAVVRKSCICRFFGRPAAALIVVWVFCSRLLFHMPPITSWVKRGASGSFAAGMRGRRPA